jgi:hypothetical protein
MRASGDASPVKAVRAALNSAEFVAAVMAATASATLSAAACSLIGVVSDTKIEFSALGTPSRVDWEA